MPAPRHLRPLPAPPPQRDLSAATLALLQPLLDQHGISAAQWAAGETSDSVAAARRAGAVLLFKAGYRQAGIARALGVDPRMASNYLHAAGLTRAKPLDKTQQPRRALPVLEVAPNAMMPGPGVRHDCTSDSACLTDLLRRCKAAKMAAPQQAHCPETCGARVAPARARG